MVTQIYSPLCLLVYFYPSTLLTLLIPLHLPTSQPYKIPLTVYIYWLLMHTWIYHFRTCCSKRWDTRWNGTSCISPLRVLCLTCPVEYLLFLPCSLNPWIHYRCCFEKPSLFVSMASNAAPGDPWYQKNLLSFGKRRQPDGKAQIVWADTPGARS